MTARARALESHRPVLVSFSMPASTIDPLNVLESCVNASRNGSRIASLSAEGLVYWSSPADDFAFVGLGAATTIVHEGPDRFQAVDAEWSALLEAAITSNSSGGLGMGPMLIGGFAFHSDGPHAAEWYGFAAAHLIAPRLLIGSVNGRCFVTFSALVGDDGELDVSAGDLFSLYQNGSLLWERESVGSTSSGFDTEVSFRDATTEAEWCALVATALDAINRHELEKVVLARAVRATASRKIPAVAALAHLRPEHPDAFVFGYWRGETAFIGASPERLVRLDGRNLSASSLAGTAKRGATDREDAEVAAMLLASEKNAIEHTFVRDSLVAELGKVCDDVTADAAPSLMSMAHVHHLHTNVTGRLRFDHSLLDVVGLLHPTPAVGGMPREAAIRFIDRHECLDRGWYSAPFGWIGRGGGEFAVALRCGVIAGEEAVLFAGCGIVAGSDPDHELAESALKLQPMKLAIGAALADSAYPTRTVPVAGERVET
ncbi:MAG TPA: isochorismate synthase [Gemmatimonadaceae bacterium]|nr:isochorismate synthase [Gemmatimonadaceae bacterium]